MFHSLNGRPPEQAGRPEAVSFLFGAFSSRRGWVWLLAAFLSVVWFDVVWCMATTFTPFSRAETYVNALLLAMIVSLPAMLFRWRLVSLLMLAALDIWLECNLLYSRTYFSAIPLSSYALAGNLSDFLPSVADSARPADLGFLLLLLLAFVFSGGRTTPLNTRPRAGYLVLTALVALISGGLLLMRGGLVRAWADLEDCYHFSCRVPMFTLAGSLANDALTENAVLSPADRAEVSAWLSGQPTPEALSDSIGRRYDNMVIILCESLENWPLGLTLEGKEITPNLNSLLADTAATPGQGRGATFYVPSVLSQVGTGRSIDAQLLVNAGMLPMQSGVYSMKAPFNSYYTLPKAMKELRGTRNYLLSVDKPVVWNQGAVASSFGIDTMLMKSAWTIDETAGGYRLKLGDRSFLRQITEKASAGEIWPEGENAFMEIITYSGHNPFTLAPELDNLNLEGEYPEVARNYLRTAHYTDEGLGILLEYLRSRSDYSRTLIVITGDHEGLADYRDGLARQLPWVSPRRMVPLIVVNSPAGGRFDGVAGQVDIYPTLLRLAGLTGYRWHGLGRDILSPGFPGVAVSPEGRIERNPGVAPLTEADSLRLTSARRISDRILRFDLLREETADSTSAPL